jgi:hypothetical protein
MTTTSPAPAADHPALAVACPRCGAAPGQLCTSHGGTRPRRYDVHQVRAAALPPATRPVTDLDPLLAEALDYLSSRLAEEGHPPARLEVTDAGLPVLYAAGAAHHHPGAEPLPAPGTPASAELARDLREGAETRFGYTTCGATDGPRTEEWRCGRRVLARETYDGLCGDCYDARTAHQREVRRARRAAATA